ncbi:MAG: four helix bundle protein [Spirosomataceae bacterium]
MKIERFEDIIAWQKSQDFAVLIYKQFNPLRDFSFKDQICRASVSVSNNIAEGFDRHTSKEFLRFLYIAKASCAEVKSMLYLAQKLDYIEEKQVTDLINSSEEISKIIRGLIKAIAKESS